MNDEKKIVLAFARLLEKEGRLKLVLNGNHIVGYYTLSEIAKELELDYESAKNLLMRLSKENHNIRFQGVLHRFVDDNYIVGLDTKWFINMLNKLKRGERG